MHYPINWTAGMALMLVVGAAIAALFAFVAVSKLFRRLYWGRERSRRRELQTALATLESCTRITEAGHCALVISFLPSGAVTYRDARRRRLRGIVKLPAEAIEHGESTGTLPIRFDPEAASSFVVIDLEGFLADRAERFERDAYIERGRPRWNAAQDATIH